MTHILDDFRNFLDHSPTSWHAALEIGTRLATMDFQPLLEEERWQLQSGKSYFVTRGGSLCAFSLPTLAPQAITLLASHTDSPGLKLKPNPEIRKEQMTLFGVEVYGSPLLSSWLNRDLGLAGRMITANAQGQMQEQLVFIDDAPLTIPQLAIHLDREVNEKGLLLNKQEHLSALASSQQEGEGFLELLLRRHFSFHSLLSFDLFLVPLEKSRFMGSQNEMLAAHGLDNRASCHATLIALARAKRPHPTQLNMAMFWDHEEIGSQTQEGASSSFLSDVLRRISLCMALPEEEMIAIKARSLCASIDAAHAFNPNWPNKSDPQHQLLLGKGIAIKHNANQRYATNAPSAAKIVQLCQNFHLPHQSFASRSDIPCGSTVGPILASSLGIPTADLGIPLLSMHSIRETISCTDHLHLCTLLTHLLQSSS
jgi:aspartyl aminopeptidase